jgi:excisionase family DNA binding protein
MAEMMPDDTKRFLAPITAAARVDVSVSTIRRWLTEGRLKSYRPSPGKVLIDAAELDALILSSVAG